MGNEQDVFEWRRYGHWKTSAEKARFSAFILWHMRQESRLSEVMSECAYSGGDADLAVLEAFRRESAVALELVVKAVIARKLEARSTDTSAEHVPANHDMPKLWKEAGLPELSREDRYRLLLFKSVLQWSGRYATPRTVDAWEKENRAFGALEYPPNVRGKFTIRTPITIGWSEFDSLYQIAKVSL